MSRATGQTTLIWSNIADLTASSSYAISFQVSHVTTTYQSGDDLHRSGERVRQHRSSDGPALRASGVASNFTGSTTASQVHTISAIQITKAEPSPEGELMRGVHDHQTTYTITVTNNAVGTTSNIVVDDYLSADLEFLGCGPWTTPPTHRHEPGKTDPSIRTRDR